MIVEMRTYTLQPGTVGQFEERFGAALAVRAKLSPLAAFWHTEVGPLNRVIHVWPYKDFEERTRVRAESQKLQGWPPNTREFVVEQQSEVFLPAPFSPKLEPRKLGGLYEIRLYTLKPGGIPGVIDRWSTAIAERVKLSPLAFAGHSEFGGLNRWCHIWAYKDAAERFAVREKARKEGIWPPKRWAARRRPSCRRTCWWFLPPSRRCTKAVSTCGAAFQQLYATAPPGNCRAARI